MANRIKTLLETYDRDHEDAIGNRICVSDMREIVDKTRSENGGFFGLISDSTRIGYMIGFTDSEQLYSADQKRTKAQVGKDLSELSPESLDRLITFLRLELDMRAGKATLEDQLRAMETIPGREAVLLAELLKAVSEN